MKVISSNYSKRFQDFFLSPASARPLAVLRICLGLLLLTQAWMLRSTIHDFFSSDGLIQGDLARILSTPGLPRISGIVQLMSPLGIQEMSIIQGVSILYLVSLILFTLGFSTLFSSVSVWFFHWILMNSGQFTTYGVDIYAHVMLFYLIWMPTGVLYSIDSLRKQNSQRKPQITVSSRARLGLRVIQLHLCISYFCSAVEKARGEQWWNGELIWRALNLPIYSQFDMSWLAQVPLLPRLGGIVSLLLEMGYFIAVWPKKTRTFWISSIALMHLGISVFLGLTLFGILMGILTLTVFGISAEPNSAPSTLRPYWDSIYNLWKTPHSSGNRAAEVRTENTQKGPLSA